jgi:hypothetical protein
MWTLFQLTIGVYLALWFDMVMTAINEAWDLHKDKRIAGD